LSERKRGVKGRNGWLEGGGGAEEASRREQNWDHRLSRKKEPELKSLEIGKENFADVQSVGIENIVETVKGGRVKYVMSLQS